MNKFGLVIFCFVLFGNLTLGLLAQNEVVSAPKPPFVANMGAYAAWTTTYTSRQTAASNSIQNQTIPQRSLTEVRVVKMDKSRQEISVWSDRRTSECWFYQGFIIFNQPGAPDVYVVNSKMPDADSFPNYSKSDFPEFSWIESKDYKGIETYQGRSCYHFQTSVTASPQNPVSAATPATGQLQAWIEVKNIRPVAFDDGHILRTYQFLDNSPHQIDLPEGFSRELKRYREALEKADGKVSE